MTQIYANTASSVVSRGSASRIAKKKETYRAEIWVPNIPGGSFSERQGCPYCCGSHIRGSNTVAAAQIKASSPVQLSGGVARKKAKMDCQKSAKPTPSQIDKINRMPVFWTML